MTEASRAVLETERVALRALGPDDAAFVLELLNEPSFLQHIGDKGVKEILLPEDQRTVKLIVITASV